MLIRDTARADYFVWQGAIGFANAIESRRQGLALFTAASPSELTIDLESTTEVDNVALSLLLAWRRDAKQQHKSLRFIHPTEALCQMAIIYDVDSLLFS